MTVGLCIRRNSDLARLTAPHERATTVCITSRYFCDFERPIRGLSLPRGKHSKQTQHSLVCGSEVRTTAYPENKFRHFPGGRRGRGGASTPSTDNTDRRELTQGQRVPRLHIDGVARSHMARGKFHGLDGDVRRLGRRCITCSPPAGRRNSHLLGSRKLKSKKKLY